MVLTSVECVVKILKVLYKHVKYVTMTFDLSFKFNRLESFKSITI